MRVFVGTLHSGESEFDECKRAIAEQVGVDVTHHVISNLPEWEAHNSLWEEWNSRKKDFDVFVKIDADTIIDDPTKLKSIADEFSGNERVTGMQVPLHDYFTDAPILGLNCFSPKVVFTPSKTRLHADHADSGHDIVLRGEAVSHLAPAGRHCSWPHERQAFHYGLHRMKKGQKETVLRMFEVWQRERDHARLVALHGAHAAIAMHSENDYSSEGFESAFLRKRQTGFELTYPIEYLVRIIK